MFGAVKVIIVKSEGKESEYAETLSQRMSTIKYYDFPEPITEKNYIANHTTLDNTYAGKVIFFGNGKETMTHASTMKWHFNKFGMKYGWLGNRCVITANSNEVADHELSAFADYYNEKMELYKIVNHDGNIKYKNYSKNSFLDETVKWKKGDDGHEKFIKTATAIIAFPLLVIGQGAEVVENVQAKLERKNLWKYQYQLLVTEFLIEGMLKFMNSLREKEVKNQVLVVYNEKDAKYAHLLVNLIQEYSDYHVAEFTEKAYQDNRSTMSAKNKIIFLGFTKAAKEKAGTLTHKHNKFGMHYGTSGNHAFIQVRKIDSDYRDEFVKYYLEKSEEYASQALKYQEHNQSTVGVNASVATVSTAYGAMAGGVTAASTLAPAMVNIIGSARLIFGLPGFIIGTAISIGGGVIVDKYLTHQNMLNNLNHYQHELVLREFLFNELKVFMGDK